MKKIGIFLLFFIILAPTVEAVPIIEIFVDEKTPSNQNIPQVVVSSIENGDLELLVWYLDTDSALHITAATERAQDLDAGQGGRERHARAGRRPRGVPCRPGE